jgi:hypothetical protein
MRLGRTVFRLLFLGAISGFLIALGVRLLERRERAHEVADAYESELMELERTVLPGISVRS